LVPNWKDMTTPLTMPIAKLSAKILTQRRYVASHAGLRVR